MIKNLVIVESPAKAKTIEKFLGKDFTVKSSMGHIRDLPKGNSAVDVENNFKPVYEIPDDKKDIVSGLKKISDNAKVVWLATDEDREGEAISWHLSEVLNLEEDKTRRIVFHEITKEAILNAVKNPRKIDKNLVDGQQARRILDRLVGFELSPVLWSKIKTGLSAGRVQSVAVRLIVDREREINKFQSFYSYKIFADFLSKQKKPFKAELIEKINKETDATKFLEDCAKANFTIEDLEIKPGKKSPSPPFITSTLQQEASRKLGFSVSRTMQVAQRLYELGYITYMRTDSVNLADSAITSALAVIKKSYGEKYVNPRKYKTKSDLAQEAHEAIRPTDFSLSAITEQSKEIESQHVRLYELIWKRAIASQMSDAILEKTVAKINISNRNEKLTATGEVIKFDGFLKVYFEGRDEEGNEDEEHSTLLPPLMKGDKVTLSEMSATQKFTRPPSRYTEASLVKRLEELGIGRPSTYAPTISTIQKRGYVSREDREGNSRTYKIFTLKGNKILPESKTEITGKEKGKLFPTDIAGVVTDFLVEKFEEIVDFSFTANVEKEFDEIAQGNKKWVKMLSEFYKPFHKQVLEVKGEKRTDATSGTRNLGKHPQSGKEIITRLGKYGPMVQMGVTVEGGEKPQYARLRTGQSIETITLEDALELFKLPRNLGDFENLPLTIGIGRFGPYIKSGNNFCSIPKGEDPHEISKERAIEIIHAKRQELANRIIREFKGSDIKVLNGRFGPYVTDGKKNARIPKSKKPEELSLEDCVGLVEGKEGESGKVKGWKGWKGGKVGK